MLLENIYQKVKGGQGTITKRLNIRDALNSKTESQLSTSEFPRRCVRDAPSSRCPPGWREQVGGFREYVPLGAAPVPRDWVHWGPGEKPLQRVCLFERRRFFSSVKL